MPSSIASSATGGRPVPIASDLKPLPPRTLADVRAQVAQEIAKRMVNKAEIFDGNKILYCVINELFFDFSSKAVRIGVSMTFSKSNDIEFLQQIAKVIRDNCKPDFLFAIATTGPPIDSDANFVLLCGSTDDYVQRATLLTTAKFVGRLGNVQSKPADSCIISVKDIGYTSGYDEVALWDVVRKSAQRPILDFHLPPSGSRGIDQILSDTRAKLQRLKPMEAYEELHEPEVHAPTILVDIRSVAQREGEGGITGSLVVDRNELEWTFDPRSNSRLVIANRYDLRIIVFCKDGKSSSLAAYSLQKLGLLNATDIIGGYSAWRDAGLPIDIPIRSTRSVLSLN